MTEPLFLLLASGAALTASLLVVRHLEQRRLAARQLAFRLHFGPDLGDGQALTSFLTGLSGLLVPWWRRLFGVSAVTFEVTASTRGIDHHLVVPSHLAEFVTGQLRAFLPTVAAVPDSDHRSIRPTLAGELALSTLERPLRSDQPAAASAAILASLLPLEADERVVLQWIATPAPPVGPVRARQGQAGEGWGLPLFRRTGHWREDADDLRARRAKRSGALFWAVGRLGVVAGPARSRQLLRRLTGVFHVLNAPGVHLRRRPLPSALVAGRLRRRSLPVVSWPCLFNASELTTVLAFPIGRPRLPGLVVGSQLLPPPADLPAAGRVVAVSTVPGSDRPLALTAADSLHHLWVLGPTGVGKSTLLGSLILQDLAARRPVVVIDPKGDLVADVVDRMPAGRADDLVLLDPSDDQRPVGLNLLAGAHQAPELVSDQVLAIFHRLYAAWWGVRTQDVLHAGLLTLAAEPGLTLCELPLLLTHAGFRRRLVNQLDDPLALEPFWAWFDSLSTPEQAQVIGPVMNKLRAFLLRRRLRNLIGQAEPTFTLSQVLAEQKILLVSLAKGLLGDEAAALIGALVVAALWQAIQGRAGLTLAERTPAFVFLDEFQEYLKLPTDLGEVLAQSRGFGVGFTLAHQHLGQLPAELRHAVLANARSKVVFQTAAGDAQVLSRELGVAPGDLQGLGRHQVMLTLSVAARVLAPATGRTLPLPPPTGLGHAARAASRERYGRDRAEVEAAIAARHRQPFESGPLRRRRRS